MRRTVAILAMLCPLLPMPAFAGWMTFVARDMATSTRLGIGAILNNDGDDEQLTIVCTPDGLTATFVPGIMLTSDMQLEDFRGPLLVAADGAAYDPFQATPERFARSDATELRLRLGKEEAIGLAQHALATQSTLAVSFRVGSEELVQVDFQNEAAAIAVGAVLDECEGR